MPLFPYKSAPLDFIVIVLIVELWQLVTTHLCMLASECQRILLWARHQRFTLVPLRDTRSLHIIVYCDGAAWASVASEVLSFLTCSSLIKASAILSWLPLITDTAWALPGLLCFPPQSHWRITAECLLPRPAWLSSMSHIDRANIKRSFFLAYLPADKKRRKIESQNFYIPVSSPSVFLSSCR